MYTPFNRINHQNNIINICYHDNNGGLNHDAMVISSILESTGFTIYQNGERQHYHKFFKLKDKYLQFIIPLFDLNKNDHNILLTIHLESILECNINTTGKNILIPNLEWLRKESYDLLSEMDLFICKTYSAKRFFDSQALPAVYTSFSSMSPYNVQYEQKPNTFIHIAGNSHYKGTLNLVKLWSEHPEWPELKVIVRNAAHLKKFNANNLNIINKFLTKDKLSQLQNESEIHLCPSEAEGFGHYICEPLSCGSIVITTDGYPMNELVQPNRGFLIKTIDHEPLRCSRRFTFDPSHLEHIIEATLRLSKNEKSKLKTNAKHWFNNNHKKFQTSFVAAIKRCIAI